MKAGMESLSKVCCKLAVIFSALYAQECVMFCIRELKLIASAKFDFFVTRAFALFDDEGLVILIDSYPDFGVRMVLPAIPDESYSSAFWPGSMTTGLESA